MLQPLSNSVFISTSFSLGNTSQNRHKLRLLPMITPRAWGHPHSCDLLLKVPKEDLERSSVGQRSHFPGHTCQPFLRETVCTADFGYTSCLSDWQLLGIFFFFFSSLSLLLFDKEVVITMDVEVGGCWCLCHPWGTLWFRKLSWLKVTTTFSSTSLAVTGYFLFVGFWGVL